MPRQRRGVIRRPPYGSTWLATAVVLALVGAGVLLAFQGDALRRELSETLTVVAEVRPTAEPTERVRFGEWLAGQAFAKTGSVEFVSAEQGAQRLREAYGEEFMAADFDNPLFDLYTFELARATLTPARADSIRASVEAHDIVLATYLQDDALADVVERSTRFGWGGIALLALLLAGTCYLIVNTARLALLGRATVIRNMELVGASWGFIARPFLWRSALVGLTAGAVAAALVLGLHRWAEVGLPSVWRPLPSEWLYSGAGVLVAAGLLLNLGATFFVIRRTLRLRVDDLG